MASKSDMLTETRIMRSIATQLDKLTTAESRARVLNFVQSSVYESEQARKRAEYEAKEQAYKATQAPDAPGIRGIGLANAGIG